MLRHRRRVLAFIYWRQLPPFLCYLGREDNVCITYFPFRGIVYEFTIAQKENNDGEQIYGNAGQFLYNSIDIGA